MTHPDDRDLGMDRPITRRDFMNGTGVALTGSLLIPAAGRGGSQTVAPKAEDAAAKNSRRFTARLAAAEAAWAAASPS